MSKNDITYIGVDIAKSKFDICVYSGNFSNCVYESFTNNKDGFFNFLSFLDSVNHLKNIRIGFEATSTYMVNLQKYLDINEIRYVLINPKKLHHFIKYKNYESKTDKLDSFYISEYVTTLDDKLFNSKHSNTKQLYKSYQSFIDMLIKTETHIKALEDSVLSGDFASVSLLKEVGVLKKSLLKTKNKMILEYTDLLRLHMPEFDLIKNDLVGVGDVTLLAVLPLIYDISEQYSIKQLQSYMGLNPVFRNSGSSVNGRQRISKSGSSYARKKLYMASLSSIQHNAEHKMKYERMIANGKPTKVAMVAISAHLFRAIVKKLNHYKAVNNAI